MENLRLKIFRVVPALSLAATLSGCAMMFSGTTQEVEIESFPQGASLYANGEFVGNTPLTLEMNRDSHPLIVLKKEGYSDTRVQLKDEWNNTTMLNAFFLPFAPVGWILDAQSGAAREYTEDRIVVPVLTEDQLQSSYYNGSVKVSNLSPSDDLLYAEKSIREIFDEEIGKYIEPVWAVSRDPSGRILGRYRATGTVWMNITISENGKILSSRVERYEGRSELKQGAEKVFQKIKSTFLLPEEFRFVCPLSITIPVKYND